MEVCIQENGNGEFDTESESIIGWMAASTRDNGLTAKHTVMVPKPDPMDRYGTMVNGKMIDQYDNDNTISINGF